MEVMLSIIFAIVVIAYTSQLVETADGDGKFCYVCSSSQDFDCFNPIHETHTQKCKYGCSLTVSRWDDGNTGVVRRCGSWQSLHSSGCTEQKINKDLTRTECICKTDYCNHAVVTPKTELLLNRCYKCDYYGSSRVEHLVNTSCLYPGDSTPSVLCPYGKCKKVFYRAGDYTGIARLCVDDVTSVSCVPDSTDSVRYEVCHCDGHLCNHSARMVQDATTALFMASLAILHTCTRGL